MIPRPYQSDDVAYFAANRDRRIIHCAPTGSGKTVIQALIAKRELDEGRRTCILTPRAEIFDQTRDTLVEVCGAENIGMLRAGHYWNRNAPIAVVSWPTLIARRRRSDAWMPMVQTVLVDECHLSASPKMSEVLDYYREHATVHGFTATPARQTGMGLGNFYDRIYQVTSVSRLIDEGYLAQCEYYAGAAPDLTGVHVRQGDYVSKELGERCTVLIGDVVDNWLRLASDRHTIVFAVDVAHAEALADRFRAVGVTAEAIHVHKHQDERERIVRDFKAQRIQVLTNVSIASYGFDAPSVNCVVAARPTKSIVLWLQMLGRGMRPNPDGGPTLVLDHTQNTVQLGMADDVFRWRLSERRSACENWTRHEANEQREPRVYECESCHYVFTAQRNCPRCNWEVPARRRDVEAVEATLTRLDGKGRELPDDWPADSFFYRMLLQYARDHKYAPGWAAHKFREKLGRWPDYPKDMLGVVPSPRVLNWIRSRNIAYAKRRAN